MTKKKQQLKVILVRGIFGCQPKHIACAHGLGLRRPHQTVVIEDTPSNRGMINKISYLLKVEEV